MALTDQDKNFLIKLKKNGKTFDEAMSILQQVRPPKAMPAQPGQEKATIATTTSVTPYPSGTYKGDGQIIESSSAQPEVSAVPPTEEPPKPNFKITSPLPGIIPPSVVPADAETGVVDRLKSAGSGIVNEFMSGAGKIKEGFQQGTAPEGENVLERGLESQTGNVKMLRGLLRTALSPLTGSVMGYVAPELEGFAQNVSDAYNALPTEVQQKLSSGLKTLDEATPEIVKEGAGLALEVGAGEALLGKFFNKLKKVDAKDIAKFTKETEKLATEILQPKAKDLRQAKLAGDTTSDGVKEYIKIAQEADTFDDALNKVVQDTNDIFNKRNELIAANNYKVDINKPLVALEKHIADVRAKGLTPKSQIDAMEEVLKNEREWLNSNKPDRLTAQNRKEDIYKEASPIYKKMDAGTALGNEEGRAKAFELLGKGYKEVVEGGNQTIADLNSRYGGLLSATEMLAQRGALADKALTPGFLEGLAQPIVSIISGATGSGSASFVTKLAAKQQGKLSTLTKKLMKLRDSAGMSKVLKNELDSIVEEIRLLPETASPSSPGIIEAPPATRKFKVDEFVGEGKPPTSFSQGETPSTTKDLTSKNKKSIVKEPKTNTMLEQEAKKYKTAEEFVAAKQKDVVYHGSNTPLDKFEDRGAFFTDDMMNADGYGGGENLYEGFLDLKNPLVIDAKGRHHSDLITKYGKSTEEIVGNVDSKKYDGVIFKNINDSFADDIAGAGTDTIFYPFNANKSFKNESQLKDIWNKANN